MVTVESEQLGVCIGMNEIITGYVFLIVIEAIGLKKCHLASVLESTELEHFLILQVSWLAAIDQVI